MDKMIISAGMAVLSLGVGFFVAHMLDSSLSNAYTSGGYLWLALGTVVIVLGMRVKQQKQIKRTALR